MTNCRRHRHDKHCRWSNLRYNSHFDAWLSYPSNNNPLRSDYHSGRCRFQTPTLQKHYSSSCHLTLRSRMSRNYRSSRWLYIHRCNPGRCLHCTNNTQRTRFPRRARYRLLLRMSRRRRNLRRPRTLHNRPRNNRTRGQSCNPRNQVRSDRRYRSPHTLR